MHTEMWENPATTANIETLVGRGVHVVGPVSGALSSGDEGPGRMVEPDEIVSEALGILARSQELSGLRVLVTAGGTYEPIDPVRFIGNRSSGLMGVTIAAEAAARGAKVTLVAGALSVPVPAGVEVIDVTTADEMRSAVVARSADADVIVKAAAVADFKPEVVATSKIKKSSGVPDIRLTPTPDILKELGTDGSLRRAGSILVGFAAETESDPRDLAAYALEKLSAKGADIIVANDVASSDSGFGAKTNRAVIATTGGVRELGLVSKRDLARELIDEIIRLRVAADH
jgi:phosphopantothenoylcysteine decarboxylase/phosphopantothenate--cysteine ligase